jgi:(1->4)-alpha-D-glucan 1-alpha-D-glucosylmutase
LPLAVKGTFKENIVAFARKHDADWAITVAPRFLARMLEADCCPLGKEVWQKTEIVLPQGAPRSWHDAITERLHQSARSLPVGAILSHFPVSLLLGQRAH